MANEHCIRFRPLSPIVVLRADFLAICNNNHCAALVLSQMMFWYEVKVAHRQQAQISNAQTVAAGETPTQDEIAWVWKKQEHLQVELMGAHGINAIGNALTWLVAKGFLRERPNPKNTWDRTKQYLFDVASVQAAVDDLPAITSPSDTDEGDENASAPRPRAGKSGANEPLELKPQSEQNRGLVGAELNQRGFNSKASTPQNRGLSYRDNVKDDVNKKTATDNPPAQTDDVLVVPADAAVAAFQNVKNNELSELVALVIEKVGIDQKSASSIVENALLMPDGADVVRRNANWWPNSGRAKNARSAGAVFRTCVEEDWASADATEKQNRAKDAKQSQDARRYVSTKPPQVDPRDVPNTADLAARFAPQPPKQETTGAVSAEELDAIYESLSQCAKERLHKQAIENAKSGAPAAWREDIEEVPVSVPDSARGKGARLVLCARKLILREWVANPFIVNNKKFYDEADARAAQTDLDFG